VDPVPRDLAEPTVNDFDFRVLPEIEPGLETLMLDIICSIYVLMVNYSLLINLNVDAVPFSKKRRKTAD
jgi:hypothetical protein